LCENAVRLAPALALTSILLVALLVAELSHAAGRVFYDGFEDGTTNKWQQDDFHNRCTVVGSALDGAAGPYNGSRMARCNWNGTVAWNDPARFESLTLNSLSYSNEIFYRVRLRIDRNVDRTNGSPLKLLRIYYWDGNTATYRDLFENSVSGNSLSNRGNAGSTTLPTYWGGAPGDNTGSSSGWHKVEYYINHATGTIKVWHDNVLIRNNTVGFNSRKWLPFYLTSNWSDPHDAANHIYFDEVEIYSDTGSGAAGSMSDASISVSGGGSSPPPALSPPNAPSNLVVQ
jgi:hypothetical protein